MLCLFPLMFAAALRWKRLPHNVRTAVCSEYSESRFYWGAVTLVFRLGMSIMFATIRSPSSTAAMVQWFLCVAMLVLLTYQKPYRVASTYHLDVLCYTSLIVQFGLEVLVRESESLGVSLSPDSPFSQTLQIAVESSFALRYVFPFLFSARLVLLMGADASVHPMHAAGTSHSSSAPYCGCISTVQPSPTTHHSSSAPPNPLLLPASDVSRVASLLLADVSLLPFNLVGSASSGVVSASNRPPTAPSFAPVTMRCFEASNRRRVLIAWLSRYIK